MVFFLIHNIYSGELLQCDDDLLDVESTNSIVPDAKVLAAYAAEVVGKSERIEGAACLFGVRTLDSICRRMGRRTMVYTEYCRLVILAQSLYHDGDALDILAERCAVEEESLLGCIGCVALYLETASEIAVGFADASTAISDVVEFPRIPSAFCGCYL